MFDAKNVGSRIKELRGKMSQEVLAEKIGISRGALSYYENGSRMPDAEIIYKMCEFFSVSADYLLGLSDVPSVDTDIQTACNVTGLSEKAIKSLYLFQDSFVIQHSESTYEFPYTELINVFLSSCTFEKIIEDLSYIFSNTIQKCSLEDLREKILPSATPASVSTPSKKLNSKEQLRLAKTDAEIKQIENIIKLHDCMLSLNIHDFVDVIIDRAERAYGNSELKEASEHGEHNPETE